MNGAHRGSPNNRYFTGRIEKRFPTSVAVYLASLDEPRARERTPFQSFCRFAPCNPVLVQHLAPPLVGQETSLFIVLSRLAASPGTFAVSMTDKRAAD